MSIKQSIEKLEKGSSLGAKRYKVIGPGNVMQLRKNCIKLLLPDQKFSIGEALEKLESRDPSAPLMVPPCGRGCVCMVSSLMIDE
jgi:hypothetical protein